jgi:hypothetical protein
MKNLLVAKCYTGPWIWKDSLEQTRQWKMDMRFGTWSIRSLYRVGSLKTVARKLVKYNLDLTAVKEVRLILGW